MTIIDFLYDLHVPEVGAPQVQGEEAALLPPSGQLRHVGDIGLQAQNHNQDSYNVLG